MHSGGQKQWEPWFKRGRGTKCSKRGLPMSFVYGCTSTSFGLAAALSFGSRHEMLEKRAPDELCKRLHLGVDFLRLSCSFAFRFRFLARDSGGQKQREPSFQRVRGTKCSKKRAPDEFCVWLHLDLLRLSFASRFRFLARDSGGQKQRAPSLQRARGTKCSKRGLPMILRMAAPRPPSA